MGEVIAQAASAPPLRAPCWPPRPPRDARRSRRYGRSGGWAASLRATASLYRSFLVAGACSPRRRRLAGSAPDRFPAVRLPALVLDAIAIAGQVIVGRSLGAGDAERAHRAARRIIEWACRRCDLRRDHARARRPAAVCLHRRRRGRRASAGDLAHLRSDATAERCGVHARRILSAQATRAT